MIDTTSIAPCPTIKRPCPGHWIRFQFGRCAAHGKLHCHSRPQPALVETGVGIHRVGPENHSCLALRPRLTGGTRPGRRHNLAIRRFIRLQSDVLQHCNRTHPNIAIGRSIKLQLDDVGNYSLHALRRKTLGGSALRLARRACARTSAVRQDNTLPLGRRLFGI